MPPAARVTDLHTCPMVTVLVPHVGGPIIPSCATTVIIGFMPAARIFDKCTCAGPPDAIMKGSATVLIQGLPAARQGDPTFHGGIISTGFPTVVIGDQSSVMGAGGSGGGAGLASSSSTLSSPAAQAQTLKQAHSSQAAFCARCQA